MRNTALGEEHLGSLHVIPGDLEAVVALAERILHLLGIGRRAIRSEEQRARGLAATHEHLVGETHLDRHAQHLGVEALGAPEVADVHTEVIESPDSHDAGALPAPSFSSAHAAARRTAASSSPSARDSAPTARLSPRFARTMAALRRSPARFVLASALPRNRARNASRSSSNRLWSGPNDPDGRSAGSRAGSALRFHGHTS